jgi:hypothetical protein
MYTSVFPAWLPVTLRRFLMLMAQPSVFGFLGTEIRRLGRSSESAEVPTPQIYNKLNTRLSSCLKIKYMYTPMYMHGKISLSIPPQTAGRCNTSYVPLAPRRSSSLPFVNKPKNTRYTHQCTIHQESLNPCKYNKIYPKPCRVAIFPFFGSGPTTLLSPSHC